MKTIQIIIAIIGMQLLTSCKTQNILQLSKKQVEILAYDSLLDHDSAYQYCIRQDDKITMSVWGHSDLSVGSTYGIYNSNEVYGKWLMVDAKGNIEVPKVGTMNVHGLTLIELKSRIKDSMSKWLINPIVDVKVLNKEISLLGEFKAPMVVTVDKEKNYLMEMVAKAGGFDKYANLKQLKLLRQKGPHVALLTIDLTQKNGFRYFNIPVYPGDVIIVPSRRYKNFDARASTIIPFTSVITATALLLGV